MKHAHLDSHDLSGLGSYIAEAISVAKKNHLSTEQTTELIEVRMADGNIKSIVSYLRANEEISAKELIEGREDTN